MPESPSTLSLKHAALGDLDHELASTRRVLERLPDAHLDWRPHPRSWTLGALALHVATTPLWGATMMRTESFDASDLPRQEPLHSRDAILALFDERAGAFREAIGAAEDAAFRVKWRLTRGGHELLNLPRGAALRGFALNHMIHHRGQLTVYLRLLDVPVPGLYGPSADEKGAS